MKFLINNIMKTAVELLQEKWLKYDLNLGKSGFNLLLKQALEQEKQQIVEAYQENMMSYTDGEKYYNETFKSE